MDQEERRGDQEKGEQQQTIAAIPVSLGQIIPLRKKTTLNLDAKVFETSKAGADKIGVFLQDVVNTLLDKWNKGEIILDIGSGSDTQQINSVSGSIPSISDPVEELSEDEKIVQTLDILKNIGVKQLPIVDKRRHRWG